jgi:hypothetical protein
MNYVVVRRKLRRTKFLLALPLLAIFAIPGSAGQPDLTPGQRLTAMQTLLGVAVDPHAASGLHIELPNQAAAMDLAFNFSAS